VGLSPVLDSLKNNCPVEWWGPHLVHEIEYEWAETRARRDAQRIVIQHKEDLANVRFFAPLHRHQAKYRAKQVNRIQRLIDYPRRARYLITLTVDPKRFYDDYSAHEGLKESWNKIRKRLQRINPDVQGLTVTEPQKSGNPHMHILLWNIHIPNYLKWASKTYKISTGHIDIQPIRCGNAGAVSYLGKYLGKGTKDNFVLGCLTRWKARTLNIFGTQLREFLGPLINRNSTGEWELWDFVTSWDDCFHKMGEEMAEIVYSSPKKGPPIRENHIICP